MFKNAEVVARKVFGGTKLQECLDVDQRAREARLADGDDDILIFEFARTTDEVKWHVSKINQVLELEEEAPSAWSLDKIRAAERQAFEDYKSSRV